MMFKIGFYSIAKAEGVDLMYTDDKGLAAVCEDNGITVRNSWELPLPENMQGVLFDD